jgi:D-3-phosphoglycerate dehydrogenase
LDPLSQEGLDLLRSAGSVEVEVRTGLTGSALHDALLEFDGAICRSGVKITAEALEGNRRLKAIARAGVGVDNIDVPAATRLGIVVMNTPGGNTISTAEQTIALMLALSRNLHPAYQGLIEGRWDRKQYTGTQLAGKTLGILGLGRIGQAVAVRALALEMKVVGCDPFLSAPRARELGIQMVASPKDLLPLVDYLSVHVPLNETTRNLIGREEIALMRKGVRLINTARGGIYDEGALVEGLLSGQLGGVALDVFEEEPCTRSPLFGMPNVLCTPHLGASTEEAQSNVALEAAELLVDFFTTGAVRQAVNSLPLDPKTLESLSGYLDLTYRLGLALAQVQRASPTACRLRYRGEVSRKDTRLLPAALAAGLLETALESPVNVVNAEMLLRERGIELVEERSSDVGDFSSTVTAELVCGEHTLAVSGTLFGNNQPRLVQWENCRMESYLHGILMVFLHRDVPGVIGRVGTTFGKHQVNIAQMSVGRPTNRPGGEAIGVLALDAQPPAEALAEILSMPTVSKAWIVHLPPAGALPAWLGG